MTKKQRNNIIKDINKIIPDLAKLHKVSEESVISILRDEYVDDEDYTVVTWPDIQDLMGLDGFKENCCLANDASFLDKYGSSAYFVNKKWLKE